LKESSGVKFGKAEKSMSGACSSIAGSAEIAGIAGTSTWTGGSAAAAKPAIPNATMKPAAVKHRKKHVPFFISISFAVIQDYASLYEQLILCQPAMLMDRGPPDTPGTLC
jgi:hypothetical protein